MRFDDFCHAGNALRPQHDARNGELVCQQLIQLHAERIDVGARVDVRCAAGRLLGTHELGRAHEGALERHRAAVQQRVGERLGDPEVDDLRLALVVGLGHQHVVRAEITVQYRLLVCVLHAIADHQEQLDAFL